MPFTVLIIAKCEDREEMIKNDELYQSLKDANSNIIELNTDNVQEIIIDCKDKDFLKKLKLLNTNKSEQNLQTFPNIHNYIQRTFFGE